MYLSSFSAIKFKSFVRLNKTCMYQFSGQADDSFFARRCYAPSREFAALLRIMRKESNYLFFVLLRQRRLSIFCRKTICNNHSFRFE